MGLTVEMVTGMSVGVCDAGKSDEADAWVTAWHSTDAVFSRGLPWRWNGSLLLFLRRICGRWMFLVAGLLLLAGTVVTLVVEVPINKQVVV